MYEYIRSILYFFRLQRLQWKLHGLIVQREPIVARACLDRGKLGETWPKNRRMYVNAVHVLARGSVEENRRCSTGGLAPFSFLGPLTS